MKTAEGDLGWREYGLAIVLVGVDMPNLLRSCFAAVLIAAAVACHDTALGPAAQPRVTLTLHTLSLPPGSGALSAPYITLRGDSIVAWTVASISGCYDYAALGEAPAGLLVLTIVARETNGFCIPEGTMEGATVVAHDVPPGPRSVSFVERFVQLDGSSHESVLAHAQIDVP